MIKLLNFSHRKSLKRIIKIASSEDMYISRKKNKFIGFFIEHKLVGIVGFYAIKKQKMIGFVSAYVLPQHRLKGIYKSLSEYRLQHSKEFYPGYSIYLTANNNSKHQLEKLGFINVEPQYRMKLDL